MITKNYANEQSVVLIHFFDLIINLFLEWSVCKAVTGIQTEQIIEGLIDGDKSIFYFFINPLTPVFVINIFFQQY